MEHKNILLGCMGLLFAVAGGVFVLVNQENPESTREIGKEAFVASVQESISEEKREGDLEPETQETEALKTQLESEERTLQPTASSRAPEPSPTFAPPPTPVAEPSPISPTPVSQPVPPPPSPQPMGNININTANSSELQQLNGIGAVLASRIIDYRDNTSLYYALEDIKNVKGIGEATFEKIKNNITVGTVSPAPTPTPPQAPPPSGTVHININTASYEKLQEITGVGEVIAQRIIDYRIQNGLFQAIEEIKNVKGIGDATFEKMKLEITV